MLKVVTDRYEGDAWNELGIDTHTALRKCCDSNPTTAAHCVISMGSFNDAWHVFLKGLWQHLNGGRFANQRRLANRVRFYATDGDWCEQAIHLYPLLGQQIVLLPEDSDHRDRAMKENPKPFYALRSIFKCFDIGDWMGFVQYLWERGKEVGEGKESVEKAEAVQ